MLAFKNMNSISESFKSNPILLNHHLIPLDFPTLLTIPDTHQWTQLPTDHPVVDPFPFGSTLPLVNLSDPNAKSLVRHACEKWGVFQVINHGVPINLLQQLDLQTRLLFSLPTHRKLSALRPPDAVTGYGLPRISVFYPKLMWSEAFSIMGSPVQHATQLWPDQPAQGANFCKVMDKYQKEMKTMSERMMELMLASMGLTLEDHLKWFKPKRAQTLLHLNSYPICPDPGRAMGLAPHTDSSLLTVLYQSSSIGLQVLREGTGWVPVHPISGALVVNVGDLMHILSNGRFKSTLHRAVVNNKYHRISAAYFYGPPSDVKISPLISLTDHDHPPLYCPVTWKEYLDTKATHFNKALDLVKNGVIVAD